jgi:hypothetical protein
MCLSLAFQLPILLGATGLEAERDNPVIFRSFNLEEKY